MAKFTRKGLHKVECGQCDGFLYATIPTLEARGLPSCGWCQGETMQPATIELALELDAQDAPVMMAYRAKVESVAHGQQGHGRSRNLESPEFRALYGDPRNRKRDPGLVEETRIASDRRLRRRTLEPAIPF